jgi:hypothetical protein
VKDRIVHAEHKVTRQEIVRYDRAGRWVLEDPVGPARPLRVDEAVHIVTRDAGWHVLHGQPGGRLFNARVRAGGGES